MAEQLNGQVLPESWIWTKIGEVGETSSGGTPSREQPSYFNGDIPWIKSGELRDTTIDFAEESITEVGLNNSSAKIFPAGTTVVALYGATVGRTGILGIDAATNQAVCAIIPRLATFGSRYLFYWLQSQREKLVGLSAGGAQRNISQGIVKELSLPLAPLNEQHRIVAAIETQFTRLDAAVTALKRAQANLKRYRAAVLKAACEGRLVPTEAALAQAEGRTYEPATALLARILAERRRRWETENPKRKYQEPVVPDMSALPVLPEGWCWTKVKDIGRVQLGRQRAPQHHNGPHMRPYLRVANVFEDRIDISDVLEMNFEPTEFEKYCLVYGDILLNEGQSPEYLGRPAMFRDEIQNACFQNTLIRFQAHDCLDRRYALIQFRNYMHTRRFMDESQITTNIAHLSVGRFSEIEFPLPPLAEQHRIIAEVERRLSLIDQLEKTLATDLARARRLRQSILQRAFAGQLVPQDPSDEPAARLLERIRHP